MSMKTRIASIFGAAIMAFGVAAPTYAQSSGQEGQVPIDVEVGSAPDAGLTWNIQQTTEFQNVPFSLEQQETTGALTATVTDTRGTREGWSLSISGTDFVGETNGDTFPIGNLRVTPGTVQVVSGQRDPLPTTNAFSLSGSPQTLISAAQGSGNGR